MDYSSPGSSVHGILQARILEWVASSLPSPRDLPNSRIKPRSPTLQANSWASEAPKKPWENCSWNYCFEHEFYVALIKLGALLCSPSLIILIIHEMFIEDLLLLLLLSCFSGVQLYTTPWTAAHQAPPSMGLSRQEYWSGVPSPSPYWGLISDQFSLFQLSVDRN